MSAITQHVGFRLDADLLARIDALIPGLSNTWRKAKRSDAIRAAIIEGLPILERRFRTPKKGGRHDA